MDRRHFLATSASAAAAATLAATDATPARTSGRIKVLIPPTKSEELAGLKAAAPGVELVECRDEGEAVDRVGDADACYGFITRRLLRAGPSLRWVQQPSAGVEHLMEIPELVEGAVVLTNMQRAYAPEIADQAIGYLLAFTRGLVQ